MESLVRQHARRFFNTREGKHGNCERILAKARTVDMKLEIVVIPVVGCAIRASTFMTASLAARRRLRRR